MASVHDRISVPLLYRLVIILFLVVASSHTLLQAQVTNAGLPNYLTGTGPYFIAPYPAEMGTVDAGTGNLHLEIPLGSFPQRGTSSSLASKLVYDSHIWVPQYDAISDKFAWTVLGLGEGIVAPRTYGTWSLVAGTNSFLMATGDRYTITNGAVTYCETDYLLWDSSGAQHYFPIVNTDPSNCPFGSGSSYAADSSGFFMQTSDTTYQVNVYAPDGSLVFNTIEGDAQGALPTIDPYMLVEDSNGNYLYSNSSAIETDTAGRAMGTTLASQYNTPPTALGVFNSQDTTSGTSDYTFTTATIPVKTNFQQSGVTECNSSCTVEVLQSISLPDSTTYAFLYDCDSTTGNSACGSPGGQTAYYGTLISMTLPTGQKISYGYTIFKDAAGNINQWLSSKTTGTAVWTYTPLVTANGGWKSSYSCANYASMDGCEQTTVVRPDTSKEITLFALNNGAWPITVTSYDTGGATVLSTVTNSWDFSNICTLALCYTSAGQENGAQFIRKTNNWTTLPVPGGSITKKQTFIYDSPATANVTGLQEWAFRSGTQATASFPTVPDRATYSVFTKIGSNNNINKPTSITICNSVGTSDANCSVGGKTVGGTTVSRTTIAYDTYGAKNSSGQQVVLPLQSVTGASNHDDTNYGSSYTARGNPTQISRWVSGSTYLTEYVSYDSTGQRVQVLDSNLNKTSYAYTDNYFYDNGEDPYNSTSGPPAYAPAATNAYATKVTDPIGTSTAGFYYGSGKPAWSKDYNGVATYSHFMDLFDRETATDMPIGWSLDTYPDVTSVQHYRAVSDTAPSTGCSGCIHTNTTLDSLSRETSSDIVNNPGGAATVTTTYDGLNREATISHPNFGSGDPNDVVETPRYDGLSRLLSITHPDSESTKLAYGAAVAAISGSLATQQSASYGIGYPIISVDEQGNLRQKWIDGFGRVIEVDEPSGAGGLKTPYYTNYSYDVLGNLTGVSQGSQTRTYQYDGLSRTTLDKTPEAGQVSYSYSVTSSTLCSGDPSNICSRTDARGIVTTYTYDAGNRLLGTSYSSTTMPNDCTMTNGAKARVCYTYGTTAASYNVGRLLTMADASGSETYTYDRIGRATQMSKVIGSTTFTTKYVYNSSGQLTQITYPSGRNVYYNYDNVGHLCVVDVSADGGCVPSTKPFLSLSNYDAAGHALKATYGNGVLALGTYSPQRGQLTSLGYGTPVSTTITSISYAGNFATTAEVVVASTAGIKMGDYIAISGNSNGIFNGSYEVSVIDGPTQLYIAFALSIAEFGNGGTLTDSNEIGTAILGLNYYYQLNSTSCPTGNSVGDNGQIQCIADSSTGAGDSGRSVSYTYDYLSRLSTATTQGSTQYPTWNLTETIDRYGNLSAQKGSTNVPPVSLTISAASNQITTSGYAYDASGNLTTTPNPGGTTSVYDGEECLTNYTSAGSTVTYTCDGNSIRMKKVVTGTGAVTTVSIYSGGRVIAEYDNGASVTAPTREYIYGDSHLLAIVTGSSGGTGGSIVYQHRDHLSPRLYTSSTGADIGEQGTFPYGESWYSTGTTSNWVYTSYERDAESSNDYAMARSYASSQARFLSPDPKEGDPSNPQTWNRYAYVGNDPINMSDPTGKNWLTDLFAAIAGLFAFITGGLDEIPVFLGADGIAADEAGIYVDAELVFSVNTAALAAGAATGAAVEWGGQIDPGGGLYNSPPSFILFQGHKVYPPSFVGPLQKGDWYGPYTADLSRPDISFAEAYGHPQASHFFGESHQCVSLTKYFSGMPGNLTSQNWRQGPRVLDSNVARGTAIATLSTGRFPQTGHPNSGIYMGPGSTPGTILIVDQWDNDMTGPHMAQERQLRNHIAGDPADSADAYYVIYVSPVW